MAGIGFQELLIIFLIIALLFGAKKIPELARGLGQAMREFKKASRGEDVEEKERKNEEVRISEMKYSHSKDKTEIQSVRSEESETKENSQDIKANLEEKTISEESKKVTEGKRAKTL